MIWSMDSADIEYYSVLGVRQDASPSEIRSAYRKLAMRWHPDKWAMNSSAAADANRRFQRVLEAYSVLSDESKRRMYDFGLYDPHEDEEEAKGFSDFMGEMLSMMNDDMQPQGENSFEELQRMFDDLVKEVDIDFQSVPNQKDTAVPAKNQPGIRTKSAGFGGGVNASNLSSGL